MMYPQAYYVDSVTAHSLLQTETNLERLREFNTCNEKIIVNCAFFGI